MDFLKNYQSMVGALQMLPVGIMWDVDRVLLGQSHHDTWRLLSKDSSTWGKNAKYAHPITLWLVERDGRQGLTAALREGEHALDQIDGWGQVWRGAVEGPARHGFEPENVFIPISPSE